MRVLIIEDDLESFLLLKEIFDPEGYELVYARDGLQALNLLGVDHRFNLVVTDLLLPDISGIQLTYLIHKGYPCLPIIAITACSSPDVHLSCLKAGCRKVFVKPFDIDLLMAAIHGLTPEMAA